MKKTHAEIAKIIFKALSLQSRGKIEEAIKILKEVKKDECDGNAFYGVQVTIASIYFGQGEYDEALKYCNLALKTTDNKLKVVVRKLQNKLYIAKGLYLYASKKRDEGIKEILKAPNIDEYIFVNFMKDLSLSDNTEKGVIQDIVPSILDSQKDNFFNSTIGEVSDEARGIYKEIYIQMLQIVALLQVTDEEEQNVAHYTTKAAAEQLLFARSPFRLNTTSTGNDPKEGLSLMECLKGVDITGLCRDAENKAFISCFTFNHESLNQFRLYGKDRGVEATGVSIVVRKGFFNESLISSIDGRKGIGFLQDLGSDTDKKKTEEGKAKNEEENQCLLEKLPLHRCVYIDPDTGKVASVGHRESYTFYREMDKDKKARISDSEAEKRIKAYRKKVEKILEEVKLQIEGNRATKNNPVVGLLPMIKKARTENKKIIELSVINNLLISLRYLVKHVAFKEEQECRIFSIQSVHDNKKIRPELQTSAKDAKFDNMFLEYKTSMAEYAYRVYFAPQTEGYDLFCDNVERYSLKTSTDKLKVMRCDFPFFKK